MEMIKSKGMIMFLVVIIGFTVVNSINTKKYDEANKELNNSYVALNIK